MGNTCIAQLFAESKGIPYLNGSMIVKTNDISRHRLLDQHPLSGFKSHCVCYFDVFSSANMAHFHALGVAPRTNPYKGNSIAVLGVHIRLNFEDEA